MAQTLLVKCDCTRQETSFSVCIFFCFNFIIWFSTFINKIVKTRVTMLQSLVKLHCYCMTNWLNVWHQHSYAQKSWWPDFHHLQNWNSIKKGMFWPHIRQYEDTKMINWNNIILFLVLWSSTSIGFRHFDHLHNLIHRKKRIDKKKERVRRNSMLANK